MIKKNAAIAKATAEKEIAIAQAEADKYEQKQKAAAQMKLADAQKYSAEQEAAGCDFSEIMKANIYDAKVTKNINLNDVAVDIKSGRSKKSDASSNEE